MAVFCGFCVSFHASSYCMLTERTSALMFQNYEKYVNKGFLFFKVFNHSTEIEAYSEPCQTSKMKGFARIFVVFLVVDYFRETLRLKYLPGF